MKKSVAANGGKALLKRIILFTLPLIATGILQLLYNAADLVVVGQFEGDGALAAVGSTGSLVNLVVNLFVGLSVGALSAMSRSIGANDEKYADDVVHTAVPISLIGGVVIGVFGFFASGWLLTVMDCPPEVLPLSTLYLKIYFAGMPFMMLYNFGASVLRACGDTKRPLIILASAGLINVGLNYALVAWAKIGVAGVAVGTTVSQFISALAVIGVLMKKKGYGHFSVKKMRISGKPLLEMVKIGLPAGIQGTIFSLSNVIIQSSINYFGKIAMAGNSASSSIEGFIYTTMNAVSQACLTFTARFYGEKDVKAMRRVFYQCVIMVTVVGAFMGAVVVLLAKPLLSVYNKDPQVIACGSERLILISATYFLCGVMEVLVGALRGMGWSTVPMIMSIFGACVLRIVWIYTIFKTYHTLFMLYLSYPVSWLITVGLHFICYIFIRRRTERKLFSELAEESVN